MNAEVLAGLKLQTADEQAVGYEPDDSIERVESQAASRGLVVRYPEPNELFLDIDSEDQMAVHAQLLLMFQRHEPCTTVTTPSPSGRDGRYHVVVKLERPVRDSAERLALQALLGSDPKRELLGWQRLARDCDERRISVFFERPAS